MDQSNQTNNSDLPAADNAGQAQNSTASPLVDTNDPSMPIDPSSLPAREDKIDQKETGMMPENQTIQNTAIPNNPPISAPIDQTAVNPAPDPLSPPAQTPSHTTPADGQTVSVPEPRQDDSSQVPDIQTKPEQDLPQNPLPSDDKQTPASPVIDSSQFEVPEKQTEEPKDPFAPYDNTQKQTDPE